VSGVASGVTGSLVEQYSPAKVDAVDQEPSFPPNCRRVAEDMVRCDLDGTIVLVEAKPKSVTMAWTTERTIAQSSPLIDHVLAGEVTEVTYRVTSPNGFTHYDSGRDEARVALSEFGRGNDDVVLFRLDAEVRGIGEVVIAYTKGIPGLRESGGSLSVTAESLRHPCLEGLFTGSTPASSQSQYPDLINTAEMLQRSLA
jgi:hypothetical protein